MCLLPLAPAIDEACQQHVEGGDDDQGEHGGQGEAADHPWVWARESAAAACCSWARATRRWPSSDSSCAMGAAPVLARRKTPRLPGRTRLP